MKRIFLVDADDTILDFHGAAAFAMQYGFSAVGVPWKDEYKTLYQTFNDSLWAKLERKELTREALMENRFPWFLQQIGFENVDGKAVNQAYISYLSTHPIYLDGAQDFLLALRKMGRIFVVTNGTDYIQKSRFSICKLHEYVDAVFISQTVGFDKPAKEYGEYVFAHVPNFKREEAVLIGDSLSADIALANRMNVDSIWFNPKGKENKTTIFPTNTCASFQEILEVLQKSM